MQDYILKDWDGNICAKPIIDIAVAVNELADIPHKMICLQRTEFIIARKKQTDSFCI